MSREKITSQLLSSLMSCYFSKENKLSFLAVSFSTLFVGIPMPPPEIKTLGMNDPATYHFLCFILRDRFIIDSPLFDSQGGEKAVMSRSFLVLGP